MKKIEDGQGVANPSLLRSILDAGLRDAGVDEALGVVGEKNSIFILVHVLL